MKFKGKLQFTKYSFNYIRTKRFIYNYLALDFFYYVFLLIFLFEYIKIMGQLKLNRVFRAPCKISQLRQSTDFWAFKFRFAFLLLDPSCLLFNLEMFLLVLPVTAWYPLIYRCQSVFPIFFYFEDYLTWSNSG
jgi:hypothetical protein